MFGVLDPKKSTMVLPVKSLFSQLGKKVLNIYLVLTVSILNFFLERLTQNTNTTNNISFESMNVSFRDFHYLSQISCFSLFFTGPILKRGNGINLMMVMFVNATWKMTRYSFECLFAYLIVQAMVSLCLAQNNLQLVLTLVLSFYSLFTAIVFFKCKDSFYHFVTGAEKPMFRR